MRIAVHTSDKHMMNIPLHTEAVAGVKEVLKCRSPTPYRISPSTSQNSDNDG